MADTKFVYTFRKDHNDYMYVPEEVQKQYPDRFVLYSEVEEAVVEEEVAVVEEVAVNKSTKRVKK